MGQWVGWAKIRPRIFRIFRDNLEREEASEAKAGSAEHKVIAALKALRHPKAQRARTEAAPRRLGHHSQTLFLQLQSRFVFFHEFLDLVSGAQQAVPLLVVERHRETSQAIDA